MEENPDLVVLIVLLSGLDLPPVSGAEQPTSTSIHILDTVECQIKIWRFQTLIA